MSFLDGLRHRANMLLRRAEYERELDDEMRFHLELDASQHEHLARGTLSARDARYAALRRFGNVTRHKEETRLMSGLGFIDVARQDIRFALRTFRRSPAFTLVAVLTLAIGIGANTAIFSAVDAMLLRPLPYAEPHELMKVSTTRPPWGDQPASDDGIWSYPKYLVLRDAQTVFESITLWSDWQATVTTNGEAERLRYELTDDRYLPTLGISPILGRNFLPEESAHIGGPRVVILGEAFWARRFNGDSSVLGRVVSIEGNPYTVVGVVPEGFRGLSGRADFIVPLVSVTDAGFDQAWSHSFYVVARRKEGVSPAQAKAAVQQLGAVVDEAFPHPEVATQKWGAVARELDATRVDPIIRRSLLILLGAVVLVLLIACANVANLFLVRAAGRRREISVRLAIGAGRRRLVRQLLTESLLLAVIGGVASLGVAWLGVRVLAAIEPASTLDLQQMSGLGAVTFSSIQLDLRAFAFAAALTILTAVLFGLVPALQATRPSFTDALKDVGERPPQRGPRGLTTRNVLVVSEIALALVLLAGSGLMLRSLAKLFEVRPGIDVENVLTLRLSPPPGYGRDSLPAFYDALIARLEALPGVTGAAMTNCIPLSGSCNGTAIRLRDRPEAARGTEPSIDVHWITPNWPTVMRASLLEGRLFASSDRVGTQKVVIVNETAAKAFWPGESPIGKPVGVGQGGFWDDTAYVAGVIADIRYDGMTGELAPGVYLSMNQSPYSRGAIFLRTAGDPASFAAAARNAIAEVAPGAPVYDVMTMKARAADAMSLARFSTMLLGLFGVVALVLAAIGTYGVIAFAVSHRTREIGIRIALGATRANVMRLIVGQGFALVIVGSLVGVAAALVATRVLASLLYGVAPTDPVTFIAIVALLGAAVLLASWIPARRAARIQPTEALREG